MPAKMKRSISAGWMRDPPVERALRMAKNENQADLTCALNGSGFSPIGSTSLDGPLAFISRKPPAGENGDRGLSAAYHNRFPSKYTLKG
jgi:hypothetical protein